MSNHTSGALSTLRWVARVSIILLLAGCATKHIDAIPSSGSVTRTITWVMTNDPLKACDDALGKPLIGKRLACARTVGDTCTIYAKPPRTEDDRTAMYILGHEALHCFVGHFHYPLN